MDFINPPKGGIFCFKEEVINKNLIALKTTCPECDGHGQNSTGGTFTLCGRIHPVLERCTNCDGSGVLVEWVDVRQLFELLDVLKAEAEIQKEVVFTKQAFLLMRNACFFYKLKGVINGYRFETRSIVHRVTCFMEYTLCHP